MPGIEPVPGEIVLAGVLRSANHFTRPIVTMSEQWGRNGTACRVDSQSASNSSQVGEMLWKCGISPCSTSRV